MWSEVFWTVPAKFQLPVDRRALIE